MSHSHPDPDRAVSTLSPPSVALPTIRNPHPEEPVPLPFKEELAAAFPDTEPSCPAEYPPLESEA